MKPYVSHPDDGNTSIEWIAHDYRFYISIEPDLKESSWGFVARRGEGEPPFMENGDLPAELVAIIEKARKWDAYNRISQNWPWVSPARRAAFNSWLADDNCQDFWQWDQLSDEALTRWEKIANAQGLGNEAP